MAKPPTCAELDKQAAVHAHRLNVVEESAGKTAEAVEAMRGKYEGEINSLRADVSTLKDEVKFWRGVVVALGSGIIPCLIGLLFKRP
jgi:prophage DNA circulation protein